MENQSQENHTTSTNSNEDVSLSTSNNHSPLLDNRTIDASTNVTNMPAIQARVSAWIYMQNPEQINQILEELNMIRLENNFENQKRLQDNLLGKYNPNDFMPEHEIADAELENARQTRLKSKANDIASESLDKSL